MSAIDHEANIAPWKDLAARLKLTIKWWRPLKLSPTNLKLVPEDLKGLLSTKTRLVTCTHASNVLGTIHDIKAIANAVHTVPNALLCVDGVAYAPHRPVDVRELGVDFYVLSWYKVFGPHVAMLYGSRKAQEQMASLGHFFNPHDTLEQKISLGTYWHRFIEVPPFMSTSLPR